MITVIGSLNMDLVTYTNHFPTDGETITSYAYHEISGGKGANQAVTIGKLGGSVHMIGSVGKDSFGDTLISQLSLHNVNISQVKQLKDTPTGMAFINVADCGDNKIILVPGANAHVSVDTINANKDLIASSDLVILQLEIPLETVTHALSLARQLGIFTLLNPAPAYPLSADVLSCVDLLTPNKTELEILSGMKITTDDDLITAAHLLLEKGVQTVIVTIGEKGALVVKKDCVLHVPGHHVKAIDTTAAGDSFTGALALSLANGSTLNEAVKFANTVASITVQRQGAQTSIPTFDEVYTQEIE